MDIQARVKKKYEELFKEIEVALSIINMIKYSYFDGHPYICSGLYFKVLNSIDLDNNCINYSMFINGILSNGEISEAELLGVINKTKMSGKLREKYKTAVNCHESSENTFGNIFDVLCNIDEISVYKRKEATFFTISVLSSCARQNRSVEVGLLLETFCEKVVNIRITGANGNVDNYKTEEGEWNNKLLVDYTVNNEKMQLVIPLLNLKKTYNIKLRAVIKEDIQKILGPVLEVFKFAISKRDLSSVSILGETIRTFRINYNMVLNHILDMIYDMYPVDVDDFNNDDMADINKILAAKGYGKLLTNEEYYDELNTSFDFEGNVEYVSEKLSEKQWDLEINVCGDLVTKIIEDFEKIRHNTTEIRCTVDGKEVIK